MNLALNHSLHTAQRDNEATGGSCDGADCRIRVREREREERIKDQAAVQIETVRMRLAS